MLLYSSIFIYIPFICDLANYGAVALNWLVTLHRLSNSIGEEVSGADDGDIFDFEQISCQNSCQELSKQDHADSLRFISDSYHLRYVLSCSFRNIMPYLQCRKRRRRIRESRWQKWRRPTRCLDANVHFLVVAVPSGLIGLIGLLTQLLVCTCHFRSL